ncbi:nucleophile aminohydrolase, partial [Thermoascus aurantiacus ATCC 26904]
EPSGPVVGPFRPQKAASPPREHQLSGQASPFSASRTLIHDLTLPPVPNLDIPPSPPGSPNPTVNKKFVHFLSLKKEGIHFNEKLTRSSSLKNPSLLTKMRQHAGIDDQAQYATSIPPELWDVSALPTWGFKEELLKSQQEIRRKAEEKRAAGQRESIEFVPAEITAGSSRGGTPSSGKAKPSAAERVMAGLSRDRTKSPADIDPGKRGTAERKARIGDPLSFGNLGQLYFSLLIFVGLSPANRSTSIVMNHLPQVWGRPRDDVYGAYDHSYLQTSGPKTHTLSPAVTGTSVVAVKFNGGVAIAADNLASYGSLARFPDVKRLRVFNNSTVIGFGGDISDMQYIDRLLESIDIRENYSSNGNTLNAKNLHAYLSKVFYKRRSEFNPLWNHILVAGFDGDGKPFLSSADLLGTTFSAPHLATGFGAHLAIPILRRLFPEEMPTESITKEQAVAALKECMKVLFYRDARSLDNYSIAVVTKEGIELKEDEKLEAQSWAFAEGIKGYGAQIN